MLADRRRDASLSLPASLALLAALSLSAWCAGCAGGDGDGPWPDLESGLDAREPLDCAAPARPPERLSQHPCFAGQPPRLVGGFVPYDVQAPFWSDGLVKERAVGVPDDALVDVRADGTVELPAGSIAVKRFLDRARAVETRILTIGEDGGADGATYLWTEDGTDARRADRSTTVDVSGGIWTAPGPEDCARCHGGASGGLLGLRVAQLNRDFDYAGDRTANQIATWVHIGLVDAGALERPDRLPRMAAYGDRRAPVADRARAYLASNCAHCHRPGGEGGSAIDLRWETPLDLTRSCDVTPELGDPWDGEGTLLRPGVPGRSVLLSRMASDDPLWRMPPVGSARVDQEAVALIEEWITSLTGCDDSDGASR